MIFFLCFVLLTIKFFYRLFILIHYGFFFFIQISMFVLHVSEFSSILNKLLLLTNTVTTKHNGINYFQVLKQTLLERTDLHEKIAENINLLIKPSVVEEKANKELESAIKAIVEKTEADPMFDKLISDLIRKYLLIFDLIAFI